MASRPGISIVVPTLDAGPNLERLLDALSSQAGTDPFEILAIDSGSTDGTVARLRARNVRVLQVDPGAFNHGGTRNQALAHASGDFGVLIVQDALPASGDWLRALLAPFADGRVAGTFGRQRAWPDASRLAEHYLTRWAAAQAEPRITGPVARADYDRMSPAERHRACAFDNVCSCVRMSVWRSHPFRPTSIAEDLQWAAEVLLDGHRIAYAPDAVVWHSHDRPVRYELQRTYLVHRELQRLFGLSTIPTVGSLARSVAITLPAHVRIAAGEPRGRRVRAMVKGAGLAVALPLGQYLGARSSREGREILRVRGV